MIVYGPCLEFRITAYLITRSYPADDVLEVSDHLLFSKVRRKCLSPLRQQLQDLGTKFSHFCLLCEEVKQILLPQSGGFFTLTEIQKQYCEYSAVWLPLFCTGGTGVCLCGYVWSVLTRVRAVRVCGALLTVSSGLWSSCCCLMHSSHTLASNSGGGMNRRALSKKVNT